MTWGLFDDSMPHHPKAIAAGPDGLALWFAAVLYSNRFHLDGVIQKHLLGVIYPSPEFTPKRQQAAAKRLVEKKVFIDQGDSWLIHDYEEHQAEALKENYEDKKTYERERKRIHRAKKKLERSRELETLSRDVPDSVPDKCPGQAGDSVPGHPRGRAPARERAPARVQSSPAQSSPESLPPTPQGAGGHPTDGDLVPFAQTYREVTGRTDVDLIPLGWSDHRRHLELAWHRCGGDVAELRRQLEVLMATNGRWIGTKPLRVWVEHLGVPKDGPRAVARPKGPAPVSPPEAFGEEMQF